MARSTRMRVRYKNKWRRHEHGIEKGLHHIRFPVGTTRTADGEPNLVSNDSQPDILLPDEPFSALDAFTKMQLQKCNYKTCFYLSWNKHETTTLLVTHDMDEASYLCDRIVIMRGQPGQIESEIYINKTKPRKRGDAHLAELKEEVLRELDFTKV